MYCNYCGRRLPDGAKFCDQCGRPVRREETENDEYQTEGNGIIQAPVETSPEGFEEPGDVEETEALEESGEVSNPLNPKKGVRFILFAVLVIIAAAVVTSWPYKLHGIYWTEKYFLVDRIEFKIDGSFSAFSYLGSHETIYEGNYEEVSEGVYSLFVSAKIYDGMEYAVNERFFSVKKVNRDSLTVSIAAQGNYIAWNGESAYFYKR